MSSRSPADAAAVRAAPAAPRTRAASPAAVRALALAALAAFAVLTQLDAVGNTLTRGLPVSATELALAGVLGGSFLMLLTPHAIDPRPRGTGGARLAAALYLWAVVCWTLSEHRAEGLDYLVKLATAIGPALCLLLIADTPRRLLVIVGAIVLAGLASAAIVLVETRTGTRLFSTSIAATTAGFEGVARSAGGSDQNPTTSAQMLLLSAALAAGLLLAGARAWRPLLAGAAALGALALVLMSARSALIGLAVALGLAGLRFRRAPWFPLALGAGFVAMLGTLPFLPPTLVDRFLAVGDFAQDPTLFRRVTYLRIGADLIGQSPIWGVGPGNFPQYYLDDAYRWMPGREPYPRELHNTFLDTATEYGLVGFALFAALLIHALHGAIAAARAVDPVLRHAAFAVGIALAGLLVACFFMPHKDMRYLWLALALAIQCGRLRKGEEAAP